MTSERQDREQLAELTRLLDAWGGSPERWSPEVGRRIERLAADSPAAARKVAEARALDRTIDHARDAPARLPRARRDDLVGSIMARALNGPPAAHQASGDLARDTPRPTAQVIALPARASPARGRLPASARPAVPRWGAAAVMAASLVLGLYVGGNVNFLPVFQEVADAVGIPAVIDPTRLALIDDITDEDAL